jgi:hypothetical protein
LLQKQAALIRQLEEELRITHMRNPEADVQQHIDALYSEKEHMSKEIYLLRETIKVLIKPFRLLIFLIISTLNVL